MRIVLDVIGRLLWAVALLGAGLGAANFVLTYSAEVLFRQSPEISAPQLAALAAESIAPAVIPYVLARAWDELVRARPRAQNSEGVQNAVKPKA